MSFILEALKKSDKNRQDGTVPSLETVHSPTLSARAKRPDWIWLLLSVLLLNAALLLWLFGPWQRQENLTAVIPQTPASHLEPALEVASPQPSETLVATPEEEQPPVRLAVLSEIAAVPKKTTVPAQSAKKIHQSRLSESAELSSSGTGPGAAQKKIHPLKELPLSVKRDLPELHMSMHAFNRDNRSANLIRINAQIMRAGASLSGKYLLEEITAEGAVFRYAGYRFLVPRKNPRK